MLSVKRTLAPFRFPDPPPTPTTKMSFTAAAEAGVVTGGCMMVCVCVNGRCCGSGGDQLTSFEMQRH